MTPNQAQLCEWLRSIRSTYAGKCAALIEAQAKQIAELHEKCLLLERARDTDPKCVKWYAAQHDFDQARIAELEADRDSWRDQCSQRVKDWHEEHERVKALEAKCSLLAASLAQEEERSAELERKHKEAFDDCGELNTANHELLAACGEKDRRIADLEAKVATAEKATRFAGLVLAEHRNDGYPGDVDGDDLQRFALESGMIEERLVESSCGSECSCADVGEFPTVCYFNTEAGKAAIAASKEKS